MKQVRYLILGFCAIILAACGSKPKNAVVQEREPALYPQFAGATLPVNIAAPSFIIDEAGEKFYTEIGKVGEEPAMSFSSSAAVVVPPLGKWHKLLAEAAGSAIYVRVTVSGQDGAKQYADVVCPVSPDSIDEYLAYRLLYPGYELWREMGIYQRNLTDYEQSAVIENGEIEQQCVNCHSFAGGAPESMMIHVRGKQGGTLIRKDGKTVKVNPKCPGLENGSTYPSWHPSGNFIAFSANNIQQFFHSKGTKTIEVSDLSADMTVYDIARGEAITAPQLSGDEWMETFPAWSPDGETLYFCRAKGYKQGEALDSIRYDLCSVSFYGASRTFGEVNVVLPAAEQGKSVSFPRVSPDGGWLLFTLSSYGNFSIWHPESDLWLMNLTDGSLRRADELNSDDVDSYHSWSSDGKWVVFSSKRMDGLWARPFIASFDNNTGRFGKPFVVPQRDPLFYDDFMKTYNIPEFVRGEIMDTEEFVSTIKNQ